MHDSLSFWHCLMKVPTDTFILKLDLHPLNIIRGKCKIPHQKRQILRDFYVGSLFLSGYHQNIMPDINPYIVE